MINQRQNHLPEHDQPTIPANLNSETTVNVRVQVVGLDSVQLQPDQRQTEVEHQVEALLGLGLGVGVLGVDVLVQDIVDLVHLRLTPSYRVRSLLKHIIMLQRLLVIKSEHALPGELLHFLFVQLRNRLAVVSLLFVFFQTLHNLPHNLFTLRLAAY